MGMGDVSEVIVEQTDHYIVQTGSPHYIIFQKGVEQADLISIAKGIRYSDKFKKDGINVNLVEEKADNQLLIRTYERGVEGETFACGTGITAAALAYNYKRNKAETVDLKAIGGELKVSSSMVSKGVFNKIDLIGPAEFVYKGQVSI